jgi:hypothetical protein
VRAACRDEGAIPPAFEHGIEGGVRRNCVYVSDVDKHAHLAVEDCQDILERRHLQEVRQLCDTHVLSIVSQIAPQHAKALASIECLDIFTWNRERTLCQGLFHFVFQSPILR